MFDQFKNTRIQTCKTYAQVARAQIVQVMKDKHSPLLSVVDSYPEAYSTDYLFRKVNQALKDLQWYESVSRFDAIDAMMDLYPYRQHLSNYNIGVTHLSEYLHNTGMDLSMFMRSVKLLGKDYINNPAKIAAHDAYSARVLLNTTLVGKGLPSAQELMSGLYDACGPKTVKAMTHVIKCAIGQDSPEYKNYITAAWNRMLGYGANPISLFADTHGYNFSYLLRDTVKLKKRTSFIKPDKYSPEQRELARSAHKRIVNEAVDSLLEVSEELTEKQEVDDLELKAESHKAVEGRLDPDALSPNEVLIEDSYDVVEMKGIDISDDWNLAISASVSQDQEQRDNEIQDTLINVMQKEVTQRFEEMHNSPEQAVLKIPAEATKGTWKTSLESEPENVSSDDEFDIIIQELNADETKRLHLIKLLNVTVDKKEIEHALAEISDNQTKRLNRLKELKKV